ncbi:hypothetical protein H5410_051017 [Solanum commersonii]|uniref:Uncharacterized protein n=1 Tax=Solanum commersonii TaxID=4109 RepID=A0A9J5WZH7_SOLCO|nr:hypothetical protein H5410_051017 [Solanum commersonii]
MMVWTTLAIQVRMRNPKGLDSKVCRLVYYIERHIEGASGSVEGSSAVLVFHFWCILWLYEALVAKFRIWSIRTSLI